MGRERRWRFQFQDQGFDSFTNESAQVTPLVAQLLASRGISSPADIRRFLENKLTELHDPSELPGVTEAVPTILAAVAAEEKICIYGDYDVDGMSATAILVLLLEAIGADVTYYIPNRLDEGYGLNEAALAELVERKVKLVVTVDCGIGSCAEAKFAKAHDLKLIITDHHQPGNELPEATAIVHPALPNKPYPFSGLCGAGVALKLAWAIAQEHGGATRVSDRMRNLLMRLLGLAALGTVADVVPLVDENRALVKYGLLMLRDDPTPGVQAMMRLTKLDQKPALQSEDIAFTIGPRLNAAGRLGYARLGAELLMTPSDERAESLAELVENLNQDRDKLERRIQLNAKQQVKEQFDPKENAALVLASADWHVGVIGIVAGRIAESFNRPTVLVSLDKSGREPGTGSARTAQGINLYEALCHCEQHLERFGGHAAAAGLKVTEANLDAFRQELCEFVERESTDIDTRPELKIDLESPFTQLTIQTLDELDQLAPFGQHNPRPVLCATEVNLAGPPKRMGKGERHLSVNVEQHGVRLRGVAFGKGDWAEELEKLSEPIDIAFRPVINEFAGRRSVEMHIIDWQLSSERESATNRGTANSNERSSTKEKPSGIFTEEGRSIPKPHSLNHSSKPVASKTGSSEAAASTSSLPMSNESKSEVEPPESEA